MTGVPNPVCKHQNQRVSIHTKTVTGGEVQKPLLPFYYPSTLCIPSLLEPQVVGVSVLPPRKLGPRAPLRVACMAVRPPPQLGKTGALLGRARRALSLAACSHSPLALIGRLLSLDVCAHFSPVPIGCWAGGGCRCLAYRAVHPPSTSSNVPVTMSAALDTR